MDGAERKLKKEKDQYVDSVAGLQESFKNIQQCYQTAAEHLKIESSKHFTVLEEKHKNLQKEIKQKKALLEKKLGDYSSMAESFSEKTSDEQCHQYINRFNELKDCYHQMCSQPAMWDKSFDNIKKEFVTTAMEYGLSKKDKSESETEDAIGDFRSLLTKVKARIDQDQGIVGKVERDLTEREIFNLIHGAIINNLVFWSQQVDSFWGSRSTINGVQVPAGISKMYEILQRDSKEFSVEQKLIHIHRIAKERQESGLGMFAKRQGTTRDFYNKILKLFYCGRRYILQQNKADFIKELEQIKDKKGQGLSLDQPLKNINRTAISGSLKISHNKT